MPLIFIKTLDGNFWELLFITSVGEVRQSANDQAALLTIVSDQLLSPLRDLWHHVSSTLIRNNLT